MIDTWFKKDIEKIYTSHNIVVFVDESKEAKFLLNKLKDEVTVYSISGELEELKTKYEIEKSTHVDMKYLIYTTTAKSELTLYHLSFLSGLMNLNLFSTTDCLIDTATLKG